MSDVQVPVQVIVAAFNSEDGAEDALQQMKELGREHLIGIKDAAILKKDSDGKLHLKETKDWGAGKGAVAGGIIGAVAGLIAGPIGWVAVGGAAIGALAAKLHDAGFPDDQLREIGEGLQPGTSAIIAVIEHQWVERMATELQDYGAKVATEELKDDIAEQLKAGDDVVYTAVATDEGVTAARITAPSDQPATASADTTAAKPAAPAADATTAPKADATATPATDTAATPPSTQPSTASQPPTPQP